MSNRSSRGLYSSWCSVFRRFCIYRRHGTQRRKSDSNERKKKKRREKGRGSKRERRVVEGGEETAVTGWTRTMGEKRNTTDRNVGQETDRMDETKVAMAKSFELRLQSGRRTWKPAAYRHFTEKNYIF